MSNEELKEALINQRPIIANFPLIGEIEYAYVSAIVYRRNTIGAIYPVAEIMDKCLNSVTQIDPKHIQYKEG